MIECRFILSILLFFFLMVQSYANTSSIRPFTVFAFIPWPIKISDIDKNDEQARTDYLQAYGIKPIRVIYEVGYFTQDIIDKKKIKRLALSHALEQNIPVSFDMEFGSRTKSETIVPFVKAILDEYRQYNPKSSVGIYATIPQNTFGSVPTDLSYAQLNSYYDSLINYVDFISPSLYNYSGHDFKSWEENAKYNLDIAKQYTPSKPILPYISPIISLGPSSWSKNGNLVEMLTENEMYERLQALREMGASGCIIWASSQDRLQDGQIPQFDPEKGWGKAVVQFIKSIPNN